MNCLLLLQPVTLIKTTSFFSAYVVNKNLRLIQVRIQLIYSGREN